MSIIRKLEEIEELEKVPFEKSLYFNFLITKKHLFTLEKVITIFYPFFTLHNHVHSNTIINNLDALKLSKLLLINPINRYELFLLLAGAYLHDIGMIEIKDEDKIESANKNIEITDIIRGRHHERSYEHILRFKDRLYLDEFEASNLAIVAKGHRKINLYENPEYRSIVCPDDSNSRIRLDLLAAILRIADELDISYKRAEHQIKEVLEKYHNFDTITQLHWLKHYYTIGPKMKILEEPGELTKLIIDIEFQLPNKDYENSFVIPFVSNPIKKEFDYLQNIFYKNGFSIVFGENIIKINNMLKEIPQELNDSLLKFLLKNININTLIIDDDELSRREFEIIIKSLGYHVDLASNSLEAMKKIENNSYHLILLDLRMPDLRNIRRDDAGVDLLKQIKKQDPHYIVVIITALKQLKLVVDCFREGAYDYVEKDWSENEIKKTIENAIKMNFHMIDDIRR